MTADWLPASLQSFAPTLSNFTTTILNLVEFENPGLKRHFPGRSMACTTSNFGPAVCTFPHKGLESLCWGLCSVTSLGSYDPTKGGHLVLWDLGLVVDFPPYSTILLPSAIMLHSNTAIRKGETRIAQYNSFGLFLRQAHGNIPKGISTTVAYWWKYLSHMFSKLGELVERIRNNS